METGNNKKVKGNKERKVNNSTCLPILLDSNKQSDKADESAIQLEVEELTDFDLLKERGRYVTVPLKLKPKNFTWEELEEYQKHLNELE